jgi:hypothetical protein
MLTPDNFQNTYRPSTELQQTLLMLKSQNLEIFPLHREVGFLPTSKEERAVELLAA